MNPNGNNLQRRGGGPLSYADWNEGNFRRQYPVCRPMPVYGNYTVQRNDQYLVVTNCTISGNQKGSHISLHPTRENHDRLTPDSGELHPVPHDGYDPGVVAKFPFSTSCNVLSAASGFYPPAEESSLDKTPSQDEVTDYHATYQASLKDYQEAWRSNHFDGVYSHPLETNNANDGLKAKNSRIIVLEDVIIQSATNSLPLYQHEPVQSFEQSSSLNLLAQAQLPYNYLPPVQVQFQIEQGAGQISPIKQRPGSSSTLLQEADLESCGYNTSSRASDNSSDPKGAKISEYKCAMCAFLSPCAAQLIEHHKLSHDVLLCERCGENFTTMADFGRHIKHHKLADKPIKCPICPKKYSSRKSLYIHRRMAHPELSRKKTK